MEFTEKINMEMTTWVNDDDNNTDNVTTENVLKFLNDTKNLCTPGFILRREIKRLVTEGKIKLDIPINSLNTKTNVPLSDEIANTLANVLAKTFETCGIYPKQWKSYLKDELFCNRETAIKIILAFKMTDEIAAKFFLASGHNFFSARNPFDYICVFCKKCGFSFDEALDMLKKFETELKTAPELATTNSTPSEGGTRALKNETENLFKTYKIELRDEKKKNLIDYMVKNRDEFSKKNKDGKYNSGFSLQKIKMLRLFTKYLVMLYPTLNAKPIKTNANGEPKIYNNFVRAIHKVYEFDALAWNFSDYEETLGVPVKSVAAIAYKIPFNSSVVIPLKNMNQILRAILRSTTEKPDNSQDLDRNTIILLTYFFISGYRNALRAKKIPPELVIENLLDAMNKATDDEKIFLTAIREIIDQINSLEKPAPFDDEKINPLDIYTYAVNQMLLCFDFTPCYLPFLLDRFVMLCLLKDSFDNGKNCYLLKVVLERAAEKTDEEIMSKKSYFKKLAKMLVKKKNL